MTQSHPAKWLQNQRAAPTFRLERWRKPLLLGYVVLNLVLIAKVLTWPEWHGFPDWKMWTLIPGYDNPYYWTEGIQPFRYSPVAVWVFAPLATLLGPAGFVAAHFALIATLPRRLALLVLVSFPFWVDLLFGNVFTLVFVAGWWAMRSNRAALLFLALTLLMPRPVQVPLALWLLWYRPTIRLPFALIFAAHAALVLLSGYGPAWIEHLATSSAGEMFLNSNVGPTRVLGYAWLLVGVPLAVLTFRRWPGLSGLLIAPYVLPQYLLLLACRLDPLRVREVVGVRPVQPQRLDAPVVTHD